MSAHTPEEIGEEWLRDSSLEKWFPLTAEKLQALLDENAKLREINAELLRALNECEVWVILACARNPETTHPEALKNAEDDFALLKAAIAKAEGRP